MNRPGAKAAKRFAPVIALGLALIAFRPAQASTIILKDGTVIEGRIVIETSTTMRVKTAFDERTIKKRDIDKVFELEPSAGPGGSTAEFDALPDHVRSLFNARADYRLGRFQAVLDRLKPYLDRPPTAANQSDILWLVIESHERLAQWDQAKSIMEKLRKEGAYTDQVRADAHLAIFKANPRYDLRVVGEVFARNFLPEDLVDAAREPHALADERIMRAALAQYCDQMLRSEKTSIKAFEEKLDLRVTLEAIRELPRDIDTSIIVQSMPYYNDLLKVEKSIHKAQAVLPGYADAFVLDLVRAETNHLTNALWLLFGEGLSASPYELTLQRDPRTGRLAPDARRAWQEACDNFLAITAPPALVGEYIREKTDAYKKELSTLRELLDDLFERLTQMRQSVARRRDRID